MAKRPVIEDDLPTLPELQQALKDARYRARFTRTARSTVNVLVVVAALAVLAATLWLPVMRIYGTSMTPSMENGDIVIAVKSGTFARGEVIAFMFNNKTLVKRVIGLPGDWIDIDERGNLSVNGEPVDEPYFTEKARGECDIELPYQVPESRLFVMGDHRSVSVDSRSTAVGCVAEEQIMGRLAFRIWPIDQMGRIE